MTAWTKMLDIAVEGNIPENRITPFVKYLEFPIACCWHGKTVTGNWEATEKVHQGSGVVFGGFLSALADYFAGTAMLTILQDNEIFFTKKLEIEYKKPLRTGNVTITATVVSQEGISAAVEVIFTNEKSDVLAIASIQQTIFSK